MECVNSLVLVVVDIDMWFSFCANDTDKRAAVVHLSLSETSPLPASLHAMVLRFSVETPHIADQCLRLCVWKSSLPRIWPKIVAIELFDCDSGIRREREFSKPSLVSHFHRQIDQHIAKECINDFWAAFGFNCLLIEVMPNNVRSLAIA